MIVNSFGRYLAQTVHDHEKPRLCVSDSETNKPRAERVWFTGTVTSGRIIIGWRVGT
jgi:hypothetical protein